MKQKFTMLASAAAVSILALTGCGAQTGATPSSSAAPSQDVTPTVATTTSPARNVAMPLKNAMLDKDGKAGLSAFAYYWFDVENYVLQTGDAQALQAISEPSCTYCSKQATETAAVYRNGGWILGGQPKVLNVYTDGAPNAAGNVKGLLVFRADPSNTYARGGVEKASTDFDSKGTVLTMEAKFTEGAWKMVSVKNTPDAKLPKPED